jgi:hypothetical protein
MLASLATMSICCAMLASVKSIGRYFGFTRVWKYSALLTHQCPRKNEKMGAVNANRILTP